MRELEKVQRALDIRFSLRLSRREAELRLELEHILN